MTLNAVIQFFFFTRHFGLWYHQTKFGCWRINSLEDVIESHILIIWALTVTMTLKIVNNFSTWHSGSRCCITISSLVTKCSAVQKISSRQLFTDILNLCCDFDLECSNPFFFFFSIGCSGLRCCTIKPRLVAMDQQFRRYIVDIVIFWLCKPALWPWHWRQWTKFFAWPSGSWCCITIPSLVTKWSVVQKISSKTFTDICNFAVTCCDLDFECRNLFFPQDTSAYDAVLSNQVWMQTDWQFRRYSRNSHILITEALTVTLTLKIANSASW